MKRLCTMLLAGLLAIAAASAQPATGKPALATYTHTGMYLMGMSDNGQWGLVFGSEECTSSPLLVNLATRETTPLQTAADITRNGICTAKDVTDDGNIVVGSYQGHPAFLDRTTGKWTELTQESGELTAVTPDGRYAAGSTNDMSTSGSEIGWYNTSAGVMYDLQTQQAINLTAAVANKTPHGGEAAYTWFSHLSPDGRHVVARMSDLEKVFTYVIDREHLSTPANFIGFTTTDGGRSYTASVKNLYFCEPMGMSANGEWVCCNAYIVEPGAAFSNEFNAPLRYNVRTGETTCYQDTHEDQAMLAGCIDNEGNLYGGTPANSAIRECYVRHGKYWYALRTILTQRYGMDYEALTAYDNTGTPLAVSADGKTLISMVDPQVGQNFCLQTEERLADVCQGLNLLGMYTLSPAPQSVFSRLSQLKLTFDREVEVVGAQTAARFGTWTSLSSNGIYIDPTDAKSVLIVFRPRTLAEGEQYTFTLPAGTLCVKGDRERTNADITATYTGRDNTPLYPTAIYPADQSVLTKLDNSSNPIRLTFPCGVTTTDQAAATLYTDGGQKIAQLIVAAYGNEVSIFPATTQYLFLDNDYKVVLEAGSLTDVSGAGGNEELTLHYHGAYERTLPTDDATLFADDFDDMQASLATWLLWEGDHLTPGSDMAAFEFDADNTPWNFSIRDNMESTDYCAAAHSVYQPAGTSNDWMLTPQFYIPVGAATLSFDAQSYTANDRLRVLVWEEDNVHSYLTDETAQRMLAEGKEVFNQTLSSGQDPELLDDDWTHYEVDLTPYAGKNIYLCFGNQNTAKSMVFVNNVRVERTMPYLLAVTNKQRVVGATSAAITGKIIGNSDRTFNTLTLTLRDSEGNTLEEQQATDLGLSLNASWPFAFQQPLPLTLGAENKFSIEVTLDGIPLTASSSIASLTHEPVKRVVLEEMTGTTCGNCPMGIVAVERMEEAFGEQFIPIAIHTYDGDIWGAGLADYTQHLGLSGAPSAVVNRASGIAYPMYHNTKTDEYLLSNGTDLWYDLVAAELDQPTDIGIEASIKYDRKTQEFQVTATVNTALNARNQNLNLLLVLMEDELKGLQTNYFASTASEALGDWGLGKVYGRARVLGVNYDDVVRATYGYSYDGTGGLLPQVLNAGQPYEAKMGGTLPASIDNAGKCKFAVLLIDANTDKIVNACVVKLSSATGIEATRSNADTQDSPAYNLQGQRVAQGYRGIVVRNGRKTVIIDN